MIAEAEIVHELPGRLRLRMAGRRGDLTYFKTLEECLARCPGVQSTELNPRTASVLLYHDVEAETIAEYGRAHDLFVVATRLETRPVPSARTIDLLRDLDSRLQQHTSGAWDLRELAFVVLCASGLVQTARRNVWPAGVSLLWYAATLVDRKRGSSTV
jgi:hypothetical protein